MKKFLKILFVLSLFGIPLSQAVLGEELNTATASPLQQVEDTSVVQPLPVGKPQRGADALLPAETRVRDTGQSSPEAHMRATRELQAEAMRKAFQRIIERARTEESPFFREFNNVIQEMQRAGETGTVGPAAQPPLPSQNTTRKPLHAEREKAYIELARQYFYVFATTPVEVPQKTPATASAREEGKEASEEAVPNKSKRDEIFDNFAACMKKISPAAQIDLIQELIRSAHTNEELKLLEDLLDEIPLKPIGDK